MRLASGNNSCPPRLFSRADKIESCVLSSPPWGWGRWQRWWKRLRGWAEEGRSRLGRPPGAWVISRVPWKSDIYFRQVYLLLSEAIEVKAIKVIDKVEPHGEKCCKNDGEKQNWSGITWLQTCRPFSVWERSEFSDPGVSSAPPQGSWAQQPLCWKSCSI